MGETYLRYANKVPKENRIAADALSGQNDLRWAILVALIERGGSPFSAIKDDLEVHQQSLSNALTALQRGGLIEKRTGDELGELYSGQYIITNFGKKILDGFYEASSPKFQTTEADVPLVEIPSYSGAKLEGYETVVQAEKSTVVSDQELTSNTLQRNTA